MSYPGFGLQLIVKVALWRRLLLGEGDGYGPQVRDAYIHTSLIFVSKIIVFDPTNEWHQTIKYSALVQDGLAGLHEKNLDSESKFKEEEEAAAQDDNSRPGVQLAYLLSRQGFPYVSVIEGGMKSISYVVVDMWSFVLTFIT